MDRFDWSAIARGIAAGALVLLPATIAASILIDTDAPSNWAFVFTFLTLVGFLTAGFTTGNRISDTPMAHAAVAGLGAWGIVQGIGIIRRLAANETITWVALPVAAFFAVTFAVTGGVLADWNRRRLSR